MKVAITGATGIVGVAAVRALVATGHDVFGLARNDANTRLLGDLGATAVTADIFDTDSLVTMFEGCDVVCSLATRIPVGYAAVLPGSWHESDRLRSEGVRHVVEAARRAGVRRIVQESVSFLYADHGEEWITEQDPIDITRATEPASVGESHVQDYSCGSRHGAVLRFGNIIGDDPITRWMLRSAARGRPIGFGRPENWAHVLHTDDIGPAVVAALTAPNGLYNVGAEPVRRADLVQGFADAVGQPSAGFAGPVMSRVAGSRIEPLTRSLRVSSEHFTAQTGWIPQRATFDASWLEGIHSETPQASDSAGQ